MAEDPKKRIEDVNKELSFLEEQLISIADRLSSSIKDTIEDIKDESEGVSKIFSKNLTRSISNIAKDSSTFLKNTQKIYDGTAKVRDIQRDIEKLANKRLAVERNLDILSRQGLITEIEKEKAVSELNEAYTVQNSLLTNQLDLASQIEKKYKDIDNKLGIFSGVLKGIGKIPIIGDLINTKDALEAAQNATTQTNSGLKGLQAGLSNLKTQFFTSVLNPANIALFLFTQFVSIIRDVDKSVGDLAKNFNITYEEAANLRGELTDIANLTGDTAVNTKGLQESMVAVGQALGSNARLNKEDLVTFTKLREQAGFTNEELVGIQKLTLATGGNLKDNTKQFLGTVAALNSQNKLSVNSKQLLKEVSNTAAAIKLSIGGTTDQLAKSAFQAKQFGINLEQADKISESLLDFESSISNELSAELITGRNLNLEKARLLALNGNIAGASAEILQQVGGTAEFTKMNRIQQEALAKAVGMSRDELAKSLIERESLAKLGGQEGTAQEQYNKLKAQGLSQEQIAAKLGDDELAKQFQQQSVQEQLNQSIEKMKELFVGVAESVLPIFNTIAGVFDIIGFIMKPLGAMMSWAGSISPGLKTVVSLLTAAGAAALFMSGSLTMGLGVAAILAAVAGGMAWYDSTMSKHSSIKDGMIDSKGGLVVSGEKGSYQLDPNDSVIAGTDLNKPNSSKSPSNSGGGGMDISPLVNELQQVKSILNQILSKEGVVTLDSTKVGTAMTVGTYKTQ